MSVAQKVIDPDFFKKPAAPAAAPAPAQPGVAAQAQAAKAPAPGARIPPRLTAAIRELARTLEAAGQENAAKGIQQVCQDVLRERFAVSVVGEFSRGKSSFINALLGREYLPVGNIPTTSLITRIRYNPSEMLIVYDKNGKRSEIRECSQEAWDGLTADNGGDAAENTVLLGVDVPWLGENSLEIIDTPGAGDLESGRTQVIGDALLRSDGAIITVTATSALSESERAFIEERLLRRKIPFMMLIVTKLDLVPYEERSAVLNYIKNKLMLWNAGIPVFVPYDVELPEAVPGVGVGMDSVKAQILGWISDPKRTALTARWLSSRACELAEAARSAMAEQSGLLRADEEKRRELLSEKAMKLKRAELVWEDLRLKLLGRCGQCCEELHKKEQEYSESIVSRLQYEASHCAKPEKWWKEDFPYRLKVELTNMSVGIENSISRRIAADAAWFNSALDKNFKAHVQVVSRPVTSRSDISDPKTGSGPQFSDIEKQRNIARLGTTALSIAGAIALSTSGLGILSLVSTMGFGTGATLISEKIFRGRIEDQRNAVRQAVASAVPAAVSDALGHGEKRIQAIYDDIITEARKTGSAWTEAQRKAISCAASGSGDAERLEADAAKIVELINILKG